RFEHARSAAFDLVLRLARAQRLGQMSPEGIEAMVGHFQNAADVRRLGTIQEQAGLDGIGVMIPVTRQEAEGHQRVEKIARRSWMEPHARAETIERLRT